MSLTPLVLSDGLAHTVTSANGEIIVSNGSTLRLRAGGSGTGPDFDPATSLGIWVGSESGPGISSAACTLDITGGSANGGSSVTQGESSAGLLSQGDSVSITGGSFSSGDDPLNAHPAAMITSPVACAISGGSFVGGSSTGNSGGAGIVLRLVGTTNATISGGSFVGGSPGGIALSAALDDTSTLTISGGVFSGAIMLRFGGSSPYVLFTGSGLAYSGGVLTGTLSDGHSISVAVADVAGGTISSGGTSGMLAIHL